MRPTTDSLKVLIQRSQPLYDAAGAFARYAQKALEDMLNPVIAANMTEKMEAEFTAQHDVLLAAIDEARANLMPRAELNEFELTEKEAGNIMPAEEPVEEPVEP